MRKARAGKKRRDSPFRRHIPSTEPVRKNPGGRWHVVTDTSPLRTTGRDLEARGLAKRLFPPDPVPETDDGSKYDRCSVASLTSGLQTPQEQLHRQQPLKNMPQSPVAKSRPSSEPQSKPPRPLQPQQPLRTSQPAVVSITLPQGIDPKSLPSPLDGSPLPFMIYLPRGVPPTKTKDHPRCHCKHCGHSRSESSITQSPSVASTIPEEPTSPEVSPLCYTCPHACRCHASKSNSPLKGRKSPMPCEYPSSAPAAPQTKMTPSPCPQDEPKAGPQKAPKPDAYRSTKPEPDPEPTPEDPSKDTGKDAMKHAANDAPKGTCETESKDTTKTKEATKPSGKDPKTSMPLWQVLLVTMGLIIFVFAFAVLVAHCLAWFLIYRTEARLGEVRAGLLRGGEMKLCLCGRGG